MTNQQTTLIQTPIMYTMNAMCTMSFRRKEEEERTFVIIISTGRAGLFGKWRWVVSPAAIPYKTLSCLTFLALLLGCDFVVGPVGAASTFAEALVTLLIGEDLLHLQGRNGTEDVLGVHKLLVAEHLAEVGCVDPAGLLELVLRILIFLVGHDLRKLDVVSVGVLD